MVLQWEFFLATKRLKINLSPDSKNKEIKFQVTSRLLNLYLSKQTLFLNTHSDFQL